MGVALLKRIASPYKDTIVNLDDLLGMPRIAVAAQHPAVKRQLEKMGVIETDEQAHKRIMEEIQQEQKRLMRELGF